MYVLAESQGLSLNKQDDLLRQLKKRRHGDGTKQMIQSNQMMQP